MKYSIFSLLLALVVFSCNSGPEGEKVESGEAMEEQGTMVEAAGYTVDANASTINWKGTKLLGGGHEGTIAIQSGRIAMSEGNIVGGDFVIDMNSITNTDLDADSGKADLEGHLKSPEFFDVATFPTAKFTIISAQAVENVTDGGPTHRVIGNFTMRDSTRSVAIPVMVSMDGDMMKTQSVDFVIDRTQWGVKYGSEGSIVDLAKENVINDDIGLSLSLVANKQ